MLKKISTLFLITMISACSVSSYIPFIGDKKAVINLDQDQIDQKSYATAYEATIETYKGRVNQDYDVNSFSSGANDWYLNRILLSIEKIKADLYQGGHDSSIHAYYSGVIFASALQTNFKSLKQGCWEQIDSASITQGIYDAMRDLQKDKVRSEDDPYIVKGSEQLLKICGH
ncbi:Uncharacterised protein [Pasteurella canis]|uniref:Lipoprotein n=1 Tax=Pasteurella canis TaxID=753 RepID=A0A379EWA1_9PAST|nr:hypothetical protein [Pasteurella canis]MXN88999.1 hypothetical protein [Pasteurella canis]GJH43295.1 hypothetical protein PA42_14690 [Pasteurella canis]SPY38478.1 Uncharacterised protein [Pasteurella canis]SUC10582.1 Uncharacterised protein [Pasteurella canis]